MSDEQEVNKSTPSHAHRQGPLTPAQRAEKQALFLAVYRECGNIKYSCSVVGIDRKTFYNWRDRSKVFQKALEDAEPEVNDTVEYAAYEEGVIGVEEPLVSMGQLVYEYEPDLDEDGNQKYDSKGKPMMIRGKLRTKRVRNASVLITLLKARMPHKYREKSQLDVNANITGTLQAGVIPIDTKSLTAEELMVLKQIALAQKAREEEG